MALSLVTLMPSKGWMPLSLARLMDAAQVNVVPMMLAVMAGGISGMVKFPAIV